MKLPKTPPTEPQKALLKALENLDQALAENTQASPFTSSEQLDILRFKTFGCIAEKCPQE